MKKYFHKYYFYYSLSRRVIYINMDENRKKHSFAVAETCKQLAVALNLEQVDPNEMFLLGLLHDIGREFESEGNYNLFNVFFEDHENAGAAFLDSQGVLSTEIPGRYKHSDAVRVHGSPTADLNDPVIWLLQEADMTTSHDGKPVTYTERLKSIGFRYGMKSEQYRTAEKIIRRLKKFTRWKQRIAINRGDDTSVSLSLFTEGVHFDKEVSIL